MTIEFSSRGKISFFWKVNLLYREENILLKFLLEISRKKNYYFPQLKEIWYVLDNKLFACEKIYAKIFGVIAN